MKKLKDGFILALLATFAGLMLQCASDPAVSGDGGVIDMLLVDLGVRDAARDTGKDGKLADSIGPKADAAGDLGGGSSCNCSFDFDVYNAGPTAETVKLEPTATDWQWANPEVNAGNVGPVLTTGAKDRVLFIASARARSGSYKHWSATLDVAVCYRKASATTGYDAVGPTLQHKLMLRAKPSNTTQATDTHASLSMTHVLQPGAGTWRFGLCVKVDSASYTTWLYGHNLVALRISK